MAKSLEQIRLFLDQDVHGAIGAATARYVIADGTALRTETVRVEHPALTARTTPDALPSDLWKTVLEAIRLREGLAELGGPRDAERARDQN